MLIEIWERLRGYDNWIETEAAIKSAETKMVIRRKRKGQLIYGWDGIKEIEWIDQLGVQQSGHLEVKGGPLVFKRQDRSPIIIRFNPASPSNFYVREQMQYQVHRGAGLVLGSAVAIGLFSLMVGHSR